MALDTHCKRPTELIFTKFLPDLGAAPFKEPMREEWEVLAEQLSSRLLHETDAQREHHLQVALHDRWAVMTHGRGKDFGIDGLYRCTAQSPLISKWVVQCYWQSVSGQIAANSSPPHEPCQHVQWIWLHHSIQEMLSRRCRQVCEGKDQIRVAQLGLYGNEKWLQSTQCSRLEWCIGIEQYWRQTTI